MVCFFHGPRSCIRFLKPPHHGDCKDKRGSVFTLWADVFVDRAAGSSSSRAVPSFFSSPRDSPLRPSPAQQRRSLLPVLGLVSSPFPLSFFYCTAHFPHPLFRLSEGAEAADRGRGRRGAQVEQRAGRERRASRRVRGRAAGPAGHPSQRSAAPTRRRRARQGGRSPAPPPLLSPPLPFPARGRWRGAATTQTPPNDCCDHPNHREARAVLQKRRSSALRPVALRGRDWWRAGLRRREPAS